MKIFGTEFRNFSEKGSYPKKTSFLGFLGVHFRHVAAALAFSPIRRIWAFHLISRRPRDVCTWSDFFVRLYLPYGFPVPVCRQPDLESSYLVGWGCEGADTVFAFSRTLTHFCDCDMQLYARSKIIHISKAITTTVKSPSKLVQFEALLASSSTNMTLTLWKSVKVA